MKFKFLSVHFRSERQRVDFRTDHFQSFLTAQFNCGGLSSLAVHTQIKPSTARRMKKLNGKYLPGCPDSREILSCDELFLRLSNRSINSMAETGIHEPQGVRLFGFLLDWVRTAASG